MEEIYSLPQIISGFDDEAINETEALFKCLTSEIIRVKPLEAELAKLFTNTWRYIKFAASRNHLT